MLFYNHDEHFFAWSNTVKLPKLADVTKYIKHEPNLSIDAVSKLQRSHRKS
jgi:hypothetical protein